LGRNNKQTILPLDEFTLKLIEEYERMKMKTVDLLGNYNYGDNGKIVITLDYGQRAFLKMIGKSSLKINKKRLRPNAILGIDMLVKKGVITETPSIGEDSCFYKATDFGIKILEAMKIL